MSDPIVEIHTGKISGTIEDGLQVYRGIPYAAPPIGERRWQAPAPADSWTGVREAKTFGASCMQPKNPMYGTGDIVTSEDCLFINVWSPAAPGAQAKLPVMVWIYGGGFSFGTTTQAVYSGERLAEKGVVIVSMNYRVGAFGFLAHPSLSRESSSGTSGNYGLLDQLAALKWVQQNIGAFGGDSGNVTVFGESAGGISVSILAASPLAAGLFHAAISESGGSFGPTRMPSMPGENLFTLADAEKAGEAFAVKLDAADLAGLRALPADTIHEASQGSSGTGWPVLDGYVVPDDQYKLYEAGKFNRTPVLVGINSDEGVMFARVRNRDDHVQYVKSRFGPFADRILALYPASSDATALRAARDLMRDLAFGWHTWAWAMLQSELGDDVYFYYFDQRPPYPDTPMYAGMRAPHAAELPYVFNHLEQSRSRMPWTSTDQDIADAMVSYWTNFAKYHTPNAPNEKTLPQWQRFSSEAQPIMVFNQKPTPATIPNPEQLEALNDYFAWRRTSDGQAFGRGGKPE